MLFDPSNVEECPSVRAPTSFLDFFHDLACHVISREQFWRTARFPVTYDITPSLFRSIRGGFLIERRNVLEHKAATFAVL
tara:strand:+ start:18 stop:257 length:240 start_codon:yes stop_codon:yes gene_type:complete